jgi:2-hydroxychromene-2-carboxylate isomerase
MPLRVPVFYDLASTIAYVAHRVLGDMASDLDALGVTLAWQPIDVAPLLGAMRGALIPPERRENALRVARDLGVPVRAPTIWLDARRANAALLGLRDDPREPALRERLWSAVFEEGVDPGAPGEVERLATQLGVTLDERALARAEDELDDRTRMAHGLGVTGVPTLMLGDWPVGGIQSRDTMRLLIGRWAAKQPKG